MLKHLFLILLFIPIMNASAQQLNKKVQDAAWKKEILLNECTRDGLLSLEEMKIAYDREYSQYTVDSALLKAIKPYLNNKTITIVMGTWCGDSRYQVPRFYKILDQLAFPEMKTRVICVDGYKKAERGLVDGLDIQRVPTFVIYENGKETGRIIEKPLATLEEDLLEILSGKE